MGDRFEGDGLAFHERGCCFFLGFVFEVSEVFAVSLGFGGLFVPAVGEPFEGCGYAVIR